MKPSPPPANASPTPSTRRKATPRKCSVPHFLDHFGLESARDLPGLKELRAAGLLESRPGMGLDPSGPSEDEYDMSEEPEEQSELFEEE
mgnify:CR=1 FL=1